MRSRRLASTFLAAGVGLLGLTGPAGAAAAPAGSAAHAVLAAASAHAVPADLLTAIGWTQTHLAMQTSWGGDVGPMGLATVPGRPGVAAASEAAGRPPGYAGESLPANFDAGAAWLAAHAVGASPMDLAAWRPSVAELVGEGGAAAAYEVLAGGLSATTANGEVVRVAPHPGLAQLGRSRAVAPRASSGSDDPRAAWVPANSNGYEAASRPATPNLDLVVIHVSQGSYAGTISYFQGPGANAASHYVTRSSDGALTQMVHDHDVAYHAGNYEYNRRAIGIEHEGYVDDPSWFTEAMYDSSARLVAAVARKYDIPIDRQHIIGHNEVPDPNHPGQYGGRDHHTDPGPYWNWTHYMELVSRYAACPATSSGPAPSPTPVGTVVAAVVGSDCALWVHRTGTAGFFSLGGALAGAPAVSASVSGLGPLYLATGVDHDLWLRTDSQGWRGATAGGAAYCIDSPAMVTTSSTLVVACQGRDHALWAASAPLAPGSVPTVSNWHSLGGALVAGPAVAVVGGQVEYQALGTDLQLYHTTAAAPAWSAMAWLCYGHPALASSGHTATLACHGQDGALYYGTNTGAGWSKPVRLGGLISGGVGVAAAASGPVFFVEGLDHTLDERGPGTGWTSDGGQAFFGAAAANT